MNKVSHNIQFNTFQSSVNVDDVSARILDKSVCIVDVHWDNDLFVRGSLGGHVEFGFWLFASTDDFLYYFNFFVLQL